MIIEKLIHLPQKKHFCNGMYVDYMYICICIRCIHAYLYIIYIYVYAYIYTFSYMHMSIYIYIIISTYKYDYDVYIYIIYKCVCIYILYLISLRLDILHLTYKRHTFSPLLTWIHFTGVKRIFPYLVISCDVSCDVISNTKPLYCCKFHLCS